MDRTRKKLTRFTETGRAEEEIESIFLSKGDADREFAKTKTLRTAPQQIDDLEDGQFGVVVVDKQIELYMRKGRNIYKQIFEKVM